MLSAHVCSFCTLDQCPRFFWLFCTRFVKHFSWTNVTVVVSCMIPYFALCTPDKVFVCVSFHQLFSFINLQLTWSSKPSTVLALCLAWTQTDAKLATFIQPCQTLFVFLPSYNPFCASLFAKQKRKGPGPKLSWLCHLEAFWRFLRVSRRKLDSENLGASRSPNRTKKVPKYRIVLAS